MSVSRVGRWKRAFRSVKKRASDSTARRFSGVEQLERRQLLAAELDHFLTDQHVDLNLQYESGEWRLGPLADEGTEEVQYTNEEAVLYVGSAASANRPDDDAFDFLGVEAGEPFHLLPANQDSDLLFLGVAGYGLEDSVDRYDAAAESKDRVGGVPGRWAKATLSDVRHTNPDGTVGNGDFSVWGFRPFGEVFVMMATHDDGVANANDAGLDVTDGISSDDALWVSAGSHSHYNFGFTQPGRYEVDLTLSAYFGDDGLPTPNLEDFRQSDPTTLVFSIESVGRIHFDASSYTVHEDAGMASIDVIRTGGSDGAISAAYATADGTADSIDYTAASGTVEFADGETVKTISIPILDDSIEESDESFTIGLSGGMPASIDGYLRTNEGVTDGLLGALSTATVTIQRNDSPVPSGVVPFALPEVVSTVPFGPTGAELADMDGDGDQDLLVPSFGTIAYLPFADGQFGAAVQVAAVGSEGAVAGDIDGDGDLDVLVAESGVGFAWYENQGSSGFGARNAILDAAGAGPATLEVHLVDVDGNGTLDAVTNTMEQGRILWHSNDGNGAFDTTGVAIPIDTPFTFGLSFADVDGDGDQDAVAANFPTSSVMWSENDGAGSFAEPVVISTDLAGAFSAIAADFDGDGDMDVVSTSNDNKVALYENDGEENFGAQRVLTTSVTGPYRVIADDVDLDGNLDIVVGSVSSGEIAWIPNDGSGVFQEARVIAEADGIVYSIALADLDGDSDHDVVASVFGASVITVQNRTGESATAVISPANGTYYTGQFVDVRVHFGSPVTVTGVPSISATIGGSATQLDYVSGSGTNALRFRYAVPAGVTDLDGIEIGTSIDLNGGSLVDVVGDPINGDDLDIPAVDLSNVFIDGVAPLVSSVTRTDDNPTAARTVDFEVTFDQAVADVDAADFEVTSDGVSGAVVTAVAGSGAVYVVSVGTGTGTGTIRLDVPSSATITGSGSTLGVGFTGGEVYTLNRRPERTIDNFYTQDHADLGANFVDGAWDLSILADDLGETFDTEELLFIAGPNSAETIPAGFEFIGSTNDTAYILPAIPIEGRPFIGVGAELTTPGTFAAYAPDDPEGRITATSPWIQLDLVDVRGPEGGHYSLYSIGASGAVVWMASSDGITDSDSYWIREGSHDHPVMAFSAPGIYEVDIVASGFLDSNGNGTLDPGVDTYSESGVTTLYFQVNATGEPTPVTLPADIVPPKNIPFNLPAVVGDNMAGASSLEPVDMDGDGDLDIVAVGYDANTVNWYENDGTGSFTTRPVATEDLVWFAEPVDIDDDGDLDILTTAYTGRMGWFANDGMGSFGEIQTIVADTYDRFVPIDMDGDGNVDIVNGGYSPNLPDDRIVWHRGLGGGNFAAPETLVDGIDGTLAFEVGDLNGDGALDVAATEGDDQVVWFLNNGDLTFAAKRSADTGSLPFLEQIVDLNGDGSPDLLVTDYFDAGYSYFAGNGDGTFAPREVLASGVIDPYSGTAGDIDGDGDMDLAIVTYGPDTLWVENLGGGNFADSRVLSKDSGNSTSVRIADFDGDGDGDLAVTSYSRGQVLMFENAMGTFENQVISPAEGLYAAGSGIELSVHFGVSVEVSGTPEVTLQVGDETVVAEYVRGSGGPALTFRYFVEESDLDLDGIALTSTAVDLAGGNITDVDGEAVSLALPSADFSGAVVNGSAPRVLSVIRVDANPTNAEDVRFDVTFSEAVSGVTMSAFVVATSGDLSGAAVTGVFGSGDTYTVTVSTGIGSGVIGLGVDGESPIVDGEGNPLGRGFVGGEVYTLQRRAAFRIDQFYERGHGDIDVGYTDGGFEFHLASDELEAEFATDEILVVGGAESIQTVTDNSAFGFLGADAGSNVFVLPQSGAGPNTPNLGFGSVAAGAFASYENTDPRVDATGAWVDVELVDVRGPEGAFFSLYRT
ncbi:MAG: FG-GAP-like repeat-containing protein, partial [Planctomycetota bacterium]